MNSRKTPYARVSNPLVALGLAGVLLTVAAVGALEGPPVARGHLAGGAEPEAKVFDAELLPAAFPTPDSWQDPASYTELARELLGTSLDERPGDARAQAAGSLDDESGVFRIGFDGGDLTGDGLADALVLEITLPEYAFEVKAHRGLDGAVLWSATLPGVYDAYPYSVGDLTGDGKSDVLVFAYTIDGEATVAEPCVAGLACAEVVRYAFHWTLQLLSGADGGNVWARSYAGEAVTSYGVASASALLAAGFAVEWAESGTNTYLYPFLVGDQDGDGARDLVVNAFDTTILYGVAAAATIGASGIAADYAVVQATHAQVVSGATGQALFALEQSPMPGAAALLPAGGAVGDATEDLLWERVAYSYLPLVCAATVVPLGDCSWDFRGVATLDLIDGATRQTAWTHHTVDPAVVYAYAYPSLADHDGDAADDLVLFEYGDAPAGLTERLALVSGADGTVGWRTPVPYYTDAYPVGDLNGDGPADLLGISFSYEAGELRVGLLRLDGPDGETLLETEHVFVEPETGFVSLYYLLEADADGDGALDVILDAATLTCFPCAWTGHDALAESSRTGAVLYEAHSEGLGYTSVAGDVDADGRDDLYDYRVDLPAAGGVDITTRLIRMPTGTPGWTRTDHTMGDAGFYARETGDQTGEGGADALFFVLDYVEDGESRSRLEALDGDSGAARWAIGDEF